MAGARTGEGIIAFCRSGRSSARLECTVRDREVGGSNPLAPIAPKAHTDGVRPWTLRVIALLGIVSIVYGFMRGDVVDIALGTAVLVSGSLGYIAWWRRR